MMIPFKGGKIQVCDSSGGGAYRARLKRGDICSADMFAQNESSSLLVDGVRLLMPRGMGNE
jgi:hypothetical protein